MKTSILWLPLITSRWRRHRGSRLRWKRKEQKHLAVSFSHNDNKHHYHRPAIMTTTNIDHSHVDQDDEAGEDRHPHLNHPRTENSELPIDFHKKQQEESQKSQTVLQQQTNLKNQLANFASEFVRVLQNFSEFPERMLKMNRREETVLSL